MSQNKLSPNLKQGNSIVIKAVHCCARLYDTSRFHRKLIGGRLCVMVAETQLRRAVWAVRDDGYTLDPEGCAWVEGMGKGLSSANEKSRMGVLGIQIKVAPVLREFLHWMSAIASTITSLTSSAAQTSSLCLLPPPNVSAAPLRLIGLWAILPSMIIVFILFVLMVLVLIRRSKK